VLILQNVPVQFGKPFLLIHTQLSPMPALQKTVQRLGDVELDVERLILLEESGEETHVVLHFLHFC